MYALEQTLSVRTVRFKAWVLVGEPWSHRITLSGIVALAAVLRLANLDALGYANHYYTAAVQAMLTSWHNFFFAAAEPGGSVSVDKPPIGSWLQRWALSISEHPVNNVTNVPSRGSTLVLYSSQTVI